MDFSTLTARGGIIKTVRAFFDGRGYLETLTPALSPDLIPETCLEAFETTLLPPPGSKTIKPQKLYLTPSPEIWMKKIIAEHRVSIYQICSSFRNCESESPVHSPEFLMLEYYTMNADYIDSLVLTEALFTALIETNKTALLRFQTEGELAAVSPPFIRLSMEEAFVRYAGFSLAAAIERGTLRQEAEHLGMNIAPQFSDADIYNIIFIDKVEPALPREKPVALLDYPAIVPTLAKHKAAAGGDDAASAWCERWELYVRGIETANCYSEETDAGEVRRYFERESAEKAKAAAVPHAIDANYWRIFAQNGGFPRCSGVAIGMDRLIMALTGKREIARVR